MLILRNATAVQFDPALVDENVDIAIDGTAIVAVGKNLTARYPAATVKEMQGRLVMPGIVCAHNHFYSGLARGILARIEPCPDFISTLKNLWWKLDRALDEESLYYSGLVCSLEAIKQGCTSVIDHHASPSLISGSLDILRRGFLTAGLRGMTCYETTVRNGGLDELRRGVEENIRFAQRIDLDNKSGKTPYLVEAHIGAHAPFTLSDAGLELLAEAIQITGRGLHIHVAEDRYDVSHSHHHYGVDPMARLARAGLLNEKSLIAHGLFLSAQDVAVINEFDGCLVHNARSNMNNQVGYNPRLAEYRHVALGTDGIGADMFEELKFACFKHRDAGGALWPDRFLRFLHQGNLLLERNFNAQFGTLAAGYQADLTICDYQSPTPLRAENLAGHLAFALNSASVHSVMVAGNLVYEDRRFPFDVEEIYFHARQTAEKLWQRMDNLAS
ncbi:MULTISPECIES: putative aminohydrolase SsnA [Brenneria]|uniref:Aminohydrolase SsnA n=1 Tax=Brenneria nigrifluens DSM 30175 = ATCC 13028 TaxID=1121120 RepID=A0A2U1ULR7_9GAMM|nr:MULTISPECIES: putative aminohydrolase SsnA [Brenneria]EHD23844.1 selenium metabolism protein SsnA [Brenneria sp. EniD312]PWC22613.1 putative aminohydrolase SsnA [Brenneria nigrifluens DSM 30175 = ATCC 13028]QCR06751.1 putative aminohydrolase SsnA [Brenneria nigrifluens DSM 30175 = ATCC 13028]